MYRFQVGSRIKHTENNLCGTVVKLVSFDDEEGVRIDVEDPDCPWYDILWDNGNEGFEHDQSVCPVVLSEDFKDRLKNHFEDSFDKKMVDDDVEQVDGIGEYLREGTYDFDLEQEKDFPGCEQEYLDLIDKLVNEYEEEFQSKFDEEE